MALALLLVASPLRHARSLLLAATLWGQGLGDQKWLLAADAAGVSGSLALKKIHDQAQQIETQEDAIKGLQQAVSEIQEKEEPISRAE